MPAAAADALVGVLVGLARTLRAAGVTATPDRVQAFVTAAASLDVRDREAVYWAGRLTLCSEPDDLPRYDRAFAAWFGGETAPRASRRPPLHVERTTAAAAAPEDGDGEAASPEEARAATASKVEVLRSRDLARLTAAERDEVRRLIAALRPAGVTRRTRRYGPATYGDVDPRRTVRAMMRRGGEPVRLERRARLERPRRVVLLVDVSGSMEPYADALLRFAHATARVRPGTDVFTIGTRLTRVTREMRLRDADAALVAVGRAVPDWSGGTRLGELLKAFLDRWGQRGVARGATVVIASDGWERGDASLLGEQMARLHRLAHRVVWVNPHKGKAGYAPLTAGILAALPHVDSFVEGHTVDALAALADLLAGTGRAVPGVLGRGSHA